MEKLKLKKSQLWVIAAAAVLVVAAVTAVMIFAVNADKKSREYSGERTEDAQILCFDIKKLGDFKVISTSNTEDGNYSEHLTAAGGAVDINIRKDHTRPNMSCKKQAKELYPKLKSYKKCKTDIDADECGCFTLSQDGTNYRHKIFLMRRGGWDYLVDFATEEKSFAGSEQYIDDLAATLHYM